MTDPNRDDDLAERVAELEETLSELREEVVEPPRGPLGLPRPPSPREVLRFTDRYAIPTAIAVLEANIKLLQLLRGALRLAAPARAARDGASETRDRAERVGRAALSRLDDALDDLQVEIEEGGLPSDPESRSIIDDARGLTDEIEERLAGGPGRDGEPAPDDGDREAVRGERGEAADSGDDEPDDDPIEIDVEGELRSIKDELGKAEDERGGDDEGEETDEASDDDEGSAASEGDPGGDDAPDSGTTD